MKRELDEKNARINPRYKAKKETKKLQEGNKTDEVKNNENYGEKKRKMKEKEMTVCTTR